MHTTKERQLKNKKKRLVEVRAGEIRYVSFGERVLAHDGATVIVLSGGYAKIKKGAFGQIYAGGSADVFGRAEVKNKGEAIVHAGGRAQVYRGGKALVYAKGKARAHGGGTVYHLPKSQATKEKGGNLIRYNGGEIDFSMRRRPPNNVFVRKTGTKKRASKPALHGSGSDTKFGVKQRRRLSVQHL